MATMLTAKDLESFKRIAVAKAGRKGRFSHLSSMLRDFEVDMSLDITDELTSDEAAIVAKFVADYGNVSSDDRAAVRGFVSAFLREMRKLDEGADIIGNYFVDAENTAHYVITRTA